MLNFKNVVFLGGDARQLEVIKSCLKMQAKVILIGFDNLQTPPSSTTFKSLAPSNLEDADILVLPIVGSDEKGEVSSVFTKEKLILTDKHVKALPKDCLVFTGIANSYLKSLFLKNNIKLFELLERDDVAIYNSIPTVEGALMMAIQNTDITIHGSESLVLGFGRVGMSLARVLKAIGSNVKVFLRKSSDMARAYEMSLNPFHLSSLAEHVSTVDFIFNTIPSLVLPKEILAMVPHDVLIVDLASKPGGLDYDFAKKRGIKAMLAPSLPGIVAPKTAGKVLANAIIQVLKEQAFLNEEKINNLTSILK